MNIGYELRTLVDTYLTPAFGGQRSGGGGGDYPFKLVWAFDGELLYIARKLGYRIAQAPVEWRHMEGSQFRPGLRTALREVGDILRIRWIHRGA